MATKPKAQAVLNTLLHHYHPGNVENLTAGLSHQAKEQLLLLPRATEQPQAVEQFLFPESEIDAIHYSWIAPLIKEYPDPLKPVILSCLPHEQRSKLAEYLSITPDTKERPIALKTLLKRNLWKRIQLPDVLPRTLLKQSSLSPLLDLSKERLTDLIDYLGIYDLADIIRHIVDKAKLKAIFACLEPRHQRFLRSCLYQSGSSPLPKLNLDNWKGDKEKLLHILHKRGLMRLAKALSGCESDFLWYITRRLDTGRGKLIERDYSKEEVPSVTEQQRQQLMTIVNFMTPEETVNE